MVRSKRLWLDLLMVIVLIIGLVAVSYPFVSNTISDAIDQQILRSYQKKANADYQQKQKEQQKMAERNQELREKGANPGLASFNAAVSEDNQKTLSTEQKSHYVKHTVGVLTIPKIDTRMPIFDETTEVLLQKGASILEGTSFPTGEKGTHSVISAHRGLAKAKLFTDLPKLKKGDRFLITLADKTQAYEVDQIKVVEPHETDDLHIDPNKELVTLLTCTPYMINSHRLLVRGHKVPYTEKDKASMTDVNQHKHWQRLLAILLVCTFSIGLTTLIYFLIRRYLIQRKQIDIRLKVVDRKGVPLANVSCSLVTRYREKPVYRDGVPLIVYTDQKGRATIPKVIGRRYQLHLTVNRQSTYHTYLKVRRLKDLYFTGYMRKGQSRQLKVKQQKHRIWYQLKG